MVFGGGDEEGGLLDIGNLPSEKVMRAVERAGRAALPQDVAGLAGMEVSAARQELVKLASLADGELQVTRNGEILYNFPKNFREVLNKRSRGAKLRSAFMAVWPKLFYGIRVGFGVMLFVSLALVLSAVVIISTAGSSDDRDNRRRGGGGGSMPMGSMGWINVGPSPFDFFYYRPYYGYYSQPRQLRKKQDPSEMGFLESTFSVIFGDGNPNADLSERQLQKAARVIRDAGGAVTAEQLAPYLSPSAPPDPSRAVVDEGFMLPVLTALDGRPEVTPGGDIVYVFDLARTSAVSSLAADTSVSEERSGQEELERLRRVVRGVVERGKAKRSDDRIIAEERIEVTRATGEQTAIATVLGAINLGGSLYLGSLLSSPALAYQMAGYLGFIQTVYPLLLGYAVLFVSIPLARTILIGKENEEIEKRNTIRSMWADQLHNANDYVTAKIRSAKRLAGRVSVVGKDDVTYTTGQSIADQDISDPGLDQFDKSQAPT
ncbi:unnamed protein product [Chrysoparadoxa australica]